MEFKPLENYLEDAKKIKASTKCSCGTAKKAGVMFCPACRKEADREMNRYD